ncbi:MAG: isoprenyl transferase [Phycisphaerae bacterium]
MGLVPLDTKEELGLEPEQLPRHIAIIMDGNGRWARQRNLPRIAGHTQGAKAVRAIVTHCARLRIDALTLYCFSAENWKRPKAETDLLMELYSQYLVAERQEIMQNNVRLMHVGTRVGLPQSVLKEMDITIHSSRPNTGLKLCLALNYGARAEIVDAIRSIAASVRDGKLEVDDIDEQLISDSLYTAGICDPDMLVRTADERRISNFLLWQISYAEIVITDCLWPDFRPGHLNDAIREFAGRERRYGDIQPLPHKLCR